MTHIWDGIAGSGKTTKAIQAAGNDMMLLTSTHRLAREHTRRYGIPARTIAGALFGVSEGRFYVNPHDVDIYAIVIDEALQTSPAVIEWAREYGGKHEIYICCDTAQMLAPHTGAACLRALDALDADRVEFTRTLRPVDDETRAMYNQLYRLAREDPDGEAAPGILKSFETADLTGLEYNPDDVYITHTKRGERTLYQRFGIAHRTDVPLIPKGYIASRPGASPEKYPVLCQLDAEAISATAYSQAANIGTVTRCQGSEVLPDHRAYYIISSGDNISNRELYTAVTRCKTLKSLYIVTLPAGSNDKRVVVPAPEIEPADCKIEGVHIWNIIKRDPGLAMTEPERLYNFIQEKTGFDGFQTPQNVDSSDARREEYKYGVDLYSSYPFCWYNTIFPDGSTYRETMDGDVKLYITTSDKVGKPRTLLTGNYVDYMAAHGHPLEVVPVGSCDAMKQNHVGEYLLNLATRSKESKQSLHGMCYGWLQKHYYTPDRGGYFIQPRARYELCMAALQSTQALQIAKLRQLIYGDCTAGRSCVDCLYFDYDGGIMDLGREIEKTIPGYRFRIFENVPRGTTREKPILYRNYEDLPTEEEYKRQQKKLQKRAERARKREKPRC